MFVEVNRRQSGKTERLIDAMYDWLDGDTSHVAYIICMNSNTAKSIIERYRRKYNCICRIMERPSNECMSNTTKDVKYFVDEFDYIDERRLAILDNAYYCTTAKKQYQFNEVSVKKQPFFVRLVKRAMAYDCLYAPKFPEFADNLPYKERLTQCYNEYMVHDDHNFPDRNSILQNDIVRRIEKLEHVVGDMELKEYAAMLKSESKGKIQ